MNPPVDYLNEDSILAVRDTPAPRNASRTGYGAKIGTSWELQLRKTASKIARVFTGKKR